MPVFQLINVKHYVGALYARVIYQDHMEPLRVGGSMVDFVNTDNTSYKSGFYRHEAGTLMNAQIYSWTKAVIFVKYQYEKNFWRVKIIIDLFKRKVSTFTKQLYIKIIGRNLMINH